MSLDDLVEDSPGLLVIGAGEVEIEIGDNTILAKKQLYSFSKQAIKNHPMGLPTKSWMGQIPKACVALMTNSRP